MDRPKLTPQQYNNPNNEPTEQSIAGTIIKRYPSFAVPTDDPDAPVPPHFIVDKGDEFTPLSLDRAIAIAVHYESAGTPHDQLVGMLDRWYALAQSTYEVTSVNAEARVEVEHLQVSSEKRLAEYVLGLGE